MQHPRKIYFDSRFRSSGTHSDFEYTLAQGFEVSDSTVAIVDTFACANEFAAIDSIGTKNHRLSFADRWWDSNANAWTITQRSVVIPDGHYDAYSLATALAVAMDAASVNTFSVTYSELSSKFSFSSSEQFKIWSREMISYGDHATNTGWNTHPRDQDICEVIGCVAGQNVLATSFEAPEMADLTPVKQLFLCSNLGSFSSMGPRGESDIIRRIDIGAAYGSYFVDRISTVGEYIDCGGQQLSTLHFVLKDATGNIVRLTKSISFSLIFMDRHMLSI